MKFCHKKSFSSANDDKERPERSTSYERNKTSEERDISSEHRACSRKERFLRRVCKKAFLFVFYCQKKRAIEKSADLVRIPITSETHSFPYI